MSCFFSVSHFYFTLLNLSKDQLSHFDLASLYNIIGPLHIISHLVKSIFDNLRHSALADKEYLIGVIKTDCLLLVGEEATDNLGGIIYCDY